MYFSCYIQNAINKNHLIKPLCTFSPKIALTLHLAPLWGLAYTWWDGMSNLMLRHVSLQSSPCSSLEKRYQWKFLVTWWKAAGRIGEPFFPGSLFCSRVCRAESPSPLHLSILSHNHPPAVRWDPELSASFSASSLRCCMIFRIGFSFCRKRYSDLDRHYIDFINCREKL